VRYSEGLPIGKSMSDGT